MKLAKKLFAIVLALALVAICMIPAFADDAKLVKEVSTEEVELNPYVDASDKAIEAIDKAAELAQKAEDASKEEEALSDMLPAIEKEAEIASIKAAAAQAAFCFTADQYAKAQEAAAKLAKDAAEAEKEAIFMDEYARILVGYAQASGISLNSRIKNVIVDQCKAAAEEMNLMTKADFEAYEGKWDAEGVKFTKCDKKADCKADKADCKASAKHVNTGDSAVLAAAAGVVLLAGVAFVVSKKRK